MDLYQHQGKENQAHLYMLVKFLQSKNNPINAWEGLACLFVLPWYNPNTGFITSIILNGYLSGHCQSCAKCAYLRKLRSFMDPVDKGGLNLAFIRKHQSRFHVASLCTSEFKVNLGSFYGSVLRPSKRPSYSGGSLGVIGLLHQIWNSKPVTEGRKPRRVWNHWGQARNDHSLARPMIPYAKWGCLKEQLHNFAE